MLFLYDLHNTLSQGALTCSLATVQKLQVSSILLIEMNFVRNVLCKVGFVFQLLRVCVLDVNVKAVGR